jgi:hypothetical protein
MSISPEYIRRCPSCEAENTPHTMRCSCGALLTGVDLSLKKSAVPALQIDDSQVSAAVPEPGAALFCAYEDCAQANPAGSEICLYCNRPLPLGAVLQTTAQTTADTNQLSQIQSLLSLPSALKNRYRILRPLPTQGAEAELLLVQELEGNAQRIAKIYRHGVQVWQISRQNIGYCS